MGTNSVSTRRRFISIAGAALSAPVAAAAVSTLPAGADRGETLEARLARLEDVEAIRALNQAYARHLNAGAHQELAALFAERSDVHIDGAVRTIAADGLRENELIEVAPDRRTATARLPCTVEIESEIGPTCPLVEMAREQGGGVVTRTEAARFESVYVRRDGEWWIASVRLAVIAPGPVISSSTAHSV